MESAKARDNWSSWNMKVLLLFICCVFCFCDVLLLRGDEVYFSFFMAVATFDID
jgi:hypothetical protein